MQETFARDHPAGQGQGTELGWGPGHGYRCHFPPQHSGNKHHRPPSEASPPR